MLTIWHQSASRAPLRQVFGNAHKEAERLQRQPNVAKGIVIEDDEVAWDERGGAEALTGNLTLAVEPGK